MKCRFIIIGFVIVIFPFLQVLFSELSWIEWKGPDVYEQILTQIVNKVYTSEFSAASGVHTICVFPKNQTTLPTGDNSVLLVGGKNKGKLPMWIIGLRAAIYNPNDYQRVVQHLPFRMFPASVVPASVTATWEYMLPVSQYVKGGTYNLVGFIHYRINEQPFQNTFYNGTIEIVHDPIRLEGVILSVASFVFCICIVVCGHGRIKNGITKKVKKLQAIADRRAATRQRNG